MGYLTLTHSSYSKPAFLTTNPVSPANTSASFQVESSLVLHEQQFHCSGLWHLLEVETAKWILWAIQILVCILHRALPLGGFPGCAGGDEQSCKMLGCSFRGVSSITREGMRDLEVSSTIWLWLIGWQSCYWGEGTEHIPVQSSPLGALSEITCSWSFLWGMLPFPSGGCWWSLLPEVI